MAQPGRKLLVTAVAPRQTATLKERAKLTIASYKVPVALELDQVAWATQAIKDSPTNTILCDADMNIIFANHKSYEILRMMAPNLHKWSDSWKSFQADEIVGSSLDFLFTDSPEEYRLAKNPRNHPYFGTVRTGPCTTEVRITGVYDSDGNATGYTVYWECITEKLAIEAKREAARVDAKQKVQEATETRLELATATKAARLKSEQKAQEAVDIKVELAKVTEAATLDSQHKALEAIRVKIALARVNEAARLELEQKALEAIDIKVGLAKVTEAATLQSQQMALEAIDIKIELARFNAAAKAEADREVQEEADEKRDLAERIGKLKVVIHDISRGNVGSRVAVEKDDLVGQLGSAFNEMADSLTAMANVATQIASGDLAVTVKPHNDRDVLGNAFAGMVTNLSALVAQTLCSAESMTNECSRISAEAQDFSKRTAEQAASSQRNAASIEQMTCTVRVNASNVTQADQLAADARIVVEKGGQILVKAVRSMDEINIVSKKIADIIPVVDEIAGQINLIAVAATIEAARAGKKGRALAAVAGEVRCLAGRSATAIKQISSLVQDSIVMTGEGSRLVKESGMQLEEIVTSVVKMADTISEISDASLQQASGIEQVNVTIKNMDQITQQTAMLVDEAAAASRSISMLAFGHQTIVERFTVKSEFLKTAREGQHLFMSPLEVAELPYGSGGALVSNERR